MKEWIEAIRAHAAERPGEEVCGFVVAQDGSARLLRATNIATELATSAIPDAGTLRLAHEADAILYAYHTHDDDDVSEEEAAKDQAYCDAFGASYLIVSPGRVRVLHPTPGWADMIGRPWKWEGGNCVEFCVEFSRRVHGIYPERPLPKWKEEDWPPQDRDVFRELAEGMGMVVLPWGSLLRFGDYLSFRLPSLENRAPRENHIGVWTGAAVLHQPNAGLSREDDLADFERYGANVYRWKVLA